MSNPKTLKVFSIIAFILSAFFTIRLFCSGTVGIVSFFLSAAMAIVLEFAKIGFFYEGLTNKNLSGTIRGTLISISILLVLSSMFASSAYVQNESNKAKNYELKNSTAFKQEEDARKIQKDLYEQVKNEVSSLQANKEKIIADMTKTRDSYPKNYYTVKENLTKEIAAKSSQLQTVIDDKVNKLNDISSSLQKPIDTSKMNILETKGYSGVFKLVANLISSEETPITPEGLELTFFIALGIIFECVAILAAYLSQVQKNNYKLNTSNTYNSNNNSNSKVIGMNRNSNNNVTAASSFDSGDLSQSKQSPMYAIQSKFYENEEPAEFKVKNPIGFKPSSTLSIKTPIVGVRTEDIKRYVIEMFKTADTDSLGQLISKGYKVIGESIGLRTQEDARKIRGWLEKENVLRVAGRKSYILIDQDAVLRKI